MKEAQALHVRSEMAALASEAKDLMDVDPWLAPEPPHPPGGTRLPHLFGTLAHQRMLDLVSDPTLCVNSRSSVATAASDFVTVDHEPRVVHLSRVYNERLKWNSTAGFIKQRRRRQYCGTIRTFVSVAPIAQMWSTALKGS